ncbi:MAG: hypothetical protein KAT34_09030 [Candidatus Aminicenantes bacterium]|nr:hypothetical protein [Candidatus Aminicenantes bacterium]
MALIKKNLFKKMKRKASPGDEKNPLEKEEPKKPIIIEFEDYHKYSKEKKYNDLLTYMNKYPNLEACIFESFYLRYKPMVDFSDDLAKILY